MSLNGRPRGRCRRYLDFEHLGAVGFDDRDCRVVLVARSDPSAVVSQLTATRRRQPQSVDVLARVDDGDGSLRPSRLAAVSPGGLFVAVERRNHGVGV